MKMQDFTTNYNLLQNENRWSRIVIMCSIVIIFVLVVALSRQKPVVTLVPTGLAEEADLHHNKAQAGIHQAWSLYLAQSLGNVTPATSSFVRATVDPLLGPTIRAETLVILEKQIDQIQRDGVSFSFEPREVLFDENTGTTRVMGRHYTHSIAGERPDQNRRTFEFKWKFENYLPQLVYIDTYEREEDKQQ